jgi:hypothetical protein
LPPACPGAPKPGTPSQVTAFLSADGRNVAVGDDVTNRVTMFDTHTGQERWSASFAAIEQYAFSPDGRTLAVDAANNANGAQVVFIDVASGTRGRALQLGNVGGVAYVQGGRAFITTVGPIAQLWDTATLEPIGTPLTMPSNDLWHVVPSGDGNEALLGSLQGNAFVWHLDPAQWEAAACRVASRTLSQNEWAKYLGNLAYHPPCT